MKIISKLIVISFCLFSSIFVDGVIAHNDDQNLDPIVACEEKTHDDYCEFYNHDGDTYRGICRDVLEDFTCVRNQPVAYATKNSEAESVDKEKDHHSH